MRTAKGRLVFEKKVNGEDKPVHNTVVRLVDDDLGPDTVLAKGVTGMDGTFCFTYDPKDAGSCDVPDLKVEIFGWEVRFNKKSGEAVEREIPLRGYEAEVHADVDVETYDFGVIRVPCWEYAPAGEKFTPRVLIDADHELVQEQRTGRKLAGVKTGVETAVQLFDPPLNKTRKIDEECPGTSQSDEYLVETMLSGFNPCLLRKDPDSGYFVDFSWKGIMQDGIHFAPDTKASFDEDLNLTSITVTKRRGYFAQAPHAKMYPPQVFTPTTSSAVEWDRAKRLWRVNYFLFGEVITHLGNTHLNVEQYTVPIYRNIRLNPVKRILLPHLQGTVAINKDADEVLTGGTGLVLSTSACTANSVALMARNGFVNANWYGWRPREVYCEKHRFAKAQKIYWEVVSEHVDRFFEENIEGIGEHWAEVKLFSDELVGNSLPYAPQETGDEYDVNEVNLSSYPHPVINGHQTAVSPVTTDEALTEENRAENIENLKQLCRYVIMVSTFRHSWVNDSQYDIGGDPDFATLGLNFDITDTTKDDAEAVTEDDKRKHILTTYILASTKYGYILKDEEHDMPPTLKKLLEGKREALAACGVDADQIRSCINI